VGGHKLNSNLNRRDAFVPCRKQANDLTPSNALSDQRL
jgi:hypothetical protein